MKDRKSFFWRGAHSFHRCLYHLVFSPKYRRRVLQKDVALRLRNLLYDACKMNRWFIHELEVMPDHVHILMQVPPTVSFASVVNTLKGGTSRQLRKEFPELEEFLWGDSFWQDGYFVETVGKTTEKAIREYVRNQWLEWERAHR